MSLFSFLTPAKDHALAVAVRLWFNKTYKRYGHMTSIQIDSTARSIRVELDLKGENSPLAIDIRSYKLVTESGETLIEIGDIETSREWLNLLLADYLKQNRRFPVPNAVKALL
jgi:hypothetical protein